MQKNLTIRYSTENKMPIVAKAFTIVVDAADDSAMLKMEKFISWVGDYGHGDCVSNGIIDCSSLEDYLSCQHKAIFLDLLPALSSSEVRARFAAVAG